MATVEDAEQAIAQAKAAYSSWRDLPALERSQLLVKNSRSDGR